jgi:hypothetical protein
MRLCFPVLIPVILSISVIGCRQPHGKEGAAGIDSTIVRADTAGRRPGPAPEVSASKSALVAQLRMMGQWLKSGDKRQIARIFHFPVPDSSLSFFGNDTAFNGARARDSDATTAATFDQYFNEISYELGFKEFSRVFQRLPVDSLLLRDSIEFDAIKKNEPCFNFYRIEIRDDSLVLITYGMNHQDNYHGPETKDPDFDISACEHDIFWEFVFDGRRLRLIRYTTAD